MAGGPNEPDRRAEPEGAAFEGVARSDRRGALVILGLAAVVLGIALLTRESAPPDRDRAAVASASPQGSLGDGRTSSPRPTPTATGGAPERDPRVTPRPTFAAEPIEAGLTTLTPPGGSTIRATVDLPAGWARAGDGMVVRSGGGAPAGASLGIWAIERIFVFPCRWSSEVGVDPALMTTAAGQARALSAWWGQDPGAPPPSNVSIAPIATRPSEARFAGYDAWYLEVLVLRGFDFHACDGAQLVFWQATDGSVRYGLGRGELHRLAVVDVDGEVVVIDAASFPGTPAADLAQLEAIVESMVIEP